MTKPSRILSSQRPTPRLRLVREPALPLPRTSAPPRRRDSAWLAAAIVLLCGVLVVLLAAWFRGGER